MARISLLLAGMVSLASLSSAMGPHYLSNHDDEMASLARRASSLGQRDVAGRAVGNHQRALGRKRHSRKRGTCSAKNSGSSSASTASTSSTSSGSSGSDTSSTGSTIGSTGSSTSGNSSSTSSSSGSSALLSQLISATGITQFIADINGPAIGSWYATNSGQDSTNGHSWCGYPYNDDTPGFAPDVSLMLANFGGDYTKAATAYCGLEAIVTGNNGATKTMYIADGFDHAWVREVGSIDIIKGNFAALYGTATDNKNDVISGVTWKLTGNRSSQYSFKGAGN